VKKKIISALLSTMLFSSFTNNLVCSDPTGKVKTSLAKRGTSGFFRDRIRELGIESSVRMAFFFNSYQVVEANNENYPSIDKTVTRLSKKLSINKPTVFVATKKVGFFGLKANAFATGDKERSVILLGSWLIDNLTNDELEGIIAHELNHIKKDHVVRNIGTLCCVGAGYLIAAATVATVLYKYGYLNKESWSKINKKFKNTPATTSAIGTSALLLPAKLLMTKLSRKFEKEADLGAIDTTGNKELATALGKFDIMQKKYSPFSRWINTKFNFLSSHPTTEARKKYIEKAKLAA